MLQTVSLVFVSLLLKSGNSSPSTEYPQGCKNEDFTAFCEGSAIPKLDRKITAFQLKNANPLIPELSPSITRLLDHLVSLQFYSAGLTILQPGALGLISDLEDLHLENNNITVIYNDTFTNCSQLLSLFLENNNIEVIHNGAFATLHSLQNMSLSHNSLHTLPSTLPQHLKYLSVHHNLLQDIPHLSLHNLTFLSLCYNLIKTIDPQQIDAKSMQEICLGGVFFTLTDKLITQEHFPVLESLHLIGTSEDFMQIEDRTIENIKIMSATSLSELELHFCRITNTNLFIGMNSSLHTLRTTNLDILDVTVRTARRPQFKFPSIVVLDFSGSANLALSFLASSTSIMAGVKILNLSRCSITSFSKSLQEKIVPNITHLDLSYNPLTCNCELSWIPDHVRNGELTLQNEEHTICATPGHLSNITLLTATLCPIVQTHPTTTVTESTVNTMSSVYNKVQTPNLANGNMMTSSSTQGFSEWSTNPPGDPRINASNPDLSGSTTKRLSRKHLILAILGILIACILTVCLLRKLSKKIKSCYKKRSFNVYTVIYS